MVQKHRSASHAAIAKDVSPMRNMVVNKEMSTPSSSSAQCIGARPSAPVASSSSSSRNVDIWKYNNMVKNNREQFNNLHFC